MEGKPTDTDTQLTASTAAKEPPPERPAAVWTRRCIIAAFWLVVVCLGLPHWTWTTSIRRSALPLEAMSAWAEGEACQLHYPLHIALQAPDLAPAHSALLAADLEARLNRDTPATFYSFSVTTVQSSAQSNSSDSVLIVNLDPTTTLASPKAKLRSWAPILDVHLSSHSQADPRELAPFLVSEIHSIFEDESAALWHLVKDTSFAHGLQPKPLAPENISQLDRRRTRAFKYAPTYHLTFSLFTPTSTPSDWDINRALTEYIQPLLNSLSITSDFTANSQVQLFASFSPSIAGPVFDSARESWTLNHGDLTGFINAAEWPLNPSIGAGLTVNFVLYVPSPEKQPLRIDDNGGTSWIIPQWGGVQIHNGLSNGTGVLTLEDLRPDMLIFAEQLATLLGVPQTPPSLSLRISSLTRERATSLILSASSTLGALSRLTLKLTSIAIPDTVAKAVDETLLRLDQACHDLNNGQFDSALKNARIAESEVEKAFFEPSMVGQVYFPEEHKVAVYVPLLGPMAVPLVMSALKELKNIRDRKQKTA